MNDAQNCSRRERERERGEQVSCYIEEDDIECERTHLDLAEELDAEEVEDDDEDDEDGDPCGGGDDRRPVRDHERASNCAEARKD